ncbi:hydroxybenzoyl-CoA thioesterase [sediment metagenome]|uniref:Hydroxybenzoyl-CoA thioesterase n=1 Tax=sediment metagenome TaxID=749907 RepID=D9PKN4_9ZZZZ
MTHIVERKIMWGDLDALGIVYYPRYYEWIDACGHHYFRELGIDVMRLLHEQKIIFALAETCCKYFKPGRYGQMIRIETRMDALSRKTFVLRHSVCCSETRQKMVEGQEKRICMDVSNPVKYAAVNIPKEIYEVLKSADHSISSGLKQENRHRGGLK